MFLTTTAARHLATASWVAALLVGAGCSNKLDGPAPTLATKDTLPLAPAIVCGDQLTTELTITGERFSPVPVNVPKHPAIALPSLTLSRVSAADGSDADPIQVLYGGDPTAPSNTDALVWDSQERMRFTIDQELDISGMQGRIPAGIYDAHITNPNGKQSVATAALAVVDKPTLTGPSPAQLCLGGPGLPLDGTGLLRIGSALPTVRIEGVDTPFDVSALEDCKAVAQKDVDAELCNVARLSLGDVSITPGMYGITLTNPETAACHTEETLQVRIDVSPIVFFVDPPTLYSEVATEVTIFTSGLGSTATKVELVRDGGIEHQTLNFTSANSPNKILAEVPKGLTPGAWDVVVTNDTGCPGVLAGGLTISNTLTDSLVTSIKPSYASTTEDTAVTVSGAGFAPVPRVYLSSASTSGTARALRAVTVASAGAALTAVIPSGLTPGVYDLIVVNPDGTMDVLSGGVTITADKPPVVTTVTPASLPANATAKPVTISGSDFKTNLTVELDCQTTGGTRTIVPTTEQAPSGDGKSVVVNITMSTASPTAVDAGSVCLVRLTNADGAFFEYSAFSVTNSSLNLSPWSTAPALQTARRALSLVAGRPTATSRYLYAIGGDNGASGAPMTVGSSVFDSVESSQVDVFGTMSAWSSQRNHLAAPRTAAGAATIGRFVYLVGGRDATAATDTLYRAEILNPLVGPEITDLEASLGDGTKGLGQGLYYYRVSALKTANDLDNPGGETLAGELFPVQLPERSEKITLMVKWQAVAGAHGYRLYRSRDANAAADDLQLLGEITCGSANTVCDCAADASRCRLLDEGMATMDGQTPLPSGSLGVWHAVNGARCSGGDCLLGSAREGSAVTAVNNPSNQNQWYLYAFGGRDAAGTYLDTYEVATVTVAADGGETVADFTAVGGDTLAVPRADLGVWVMSKHNSNVIAASGTPDDVWVYVGGGRTTGGATNKTLEAVKLGTNGLLNPFVSTDPLNGTLVGFGAGASNDQLYTFGGVAGTADGTSASLCDGSGSCGALPDLKPGAFNSLGSATTRRMFAGSTQESAFFFVAGGHDGTNTLTTAQSTVQ